MPKYTLMTRDDVLYGVGIDYDTIQDVLSHLSNHDWVAYKETGPDDIVRTANLRCSEVIAVSEYEENEGAPSVKNGAGIKTLNQRAAPTPFNRLPPMRYGSPSVYYDDSFEHNQALQWMRKAFETRWAKEITDDQ